RVPTPEDAFFSNLPVDIRDRLHTFSDAARKPLPLNREEAESWREFVIAAFRAKAVIDAQSFIDWLAAAGWPRETAAELNLRFFDHCLLLSRYADGKSGKSGPGRPGWLPTPASGKEVTSPPPPPLRTARESFPSCSSSLSNALCRTRLSHISLLAVDLLMAVRMHQHAVLDRILAPMGSPHDMVVVPPRHRGDLLVANRT